MPILLYWKSQMQLMNHHCKELVLSFCHGTADHLHKFPWASIMSVYSVKCICQVNEDIVKRLVLLNTLLLDLLVLFWPKTTLHVWELPF